MTRRSGLNIGTLSHLRTGRFALLVAALVINLLSLALPITLLQVYDRSSTQFDPDPDAFGVGGSGCIGA